MFWLVIKQCIWYSTLSIHQVEVLINNMFFSENEWKDTFRNSDCFENSWGRGQTLGSVFKSLTTLSLELKVSVPSSLLYWMQYWFSEISTKSNMLVHWEKTIAFIGPSVDEFEYAIDVALDPVEPLNPEIGLSTLQGGWTLRNYTHADWCIIKCGIWGTSIKVVRDSSSKSSFRENNIRTKLFFAVRSRASIIISCQVFWHTLIAENIGFWVLGLGKAMRRRIGGLRVFSLFQWFKFKPFLLFN